VRGSRTLGNRAPARRPPRRSTFAIRVVHGSKSQKSNVYRRTAPEITNLRAGLGAVTGRRSAGEAEPPALRQPSGDQKVGPTWADRIARHRRVCPQGLELVFGDVALPKYARSASLGFGKDVIRRAPPNFPPGNRGGESENEKLLLTFRSERGRNPPGQNVGRVLPSGGGRHRSTNPFEGRLMKLEEIAPLQNPLHVADIGAACINETPPYKALMDRGLARLSAFDADERQKDKLVQAYGSAFDLYTDIIADGELHTLYLMAPESGMSSILAPSEKHLNFFNGFSVFGMVHDQIVIQSRRLDDIEELTAIDFLKMDIQGAELLVLKNATKKLAKCVAIQLEISFVPLYKQQPTFGEIDGWMRSNGYLPHSFVDIKKWSISPTIRAGNFRIPFNQLLEADIVYVKDPLAIDVFTSECLKELAHISFYCYNSVDLAVYCLLELERRGEIPQGSAHGFLA